MLETRVAAGYAALKTWWPGFESQVDLDTLNLSDGRECVLGQVGRARGLGSYGDMLSAWTARAEGDSFGNATTVGSNPWAEAHGFTLSTVSCESRDGGGCACEGLWAELTAEWRRVLSRETVAA